MDWKSCTAPRHLGSGCLGTTEPRGVRNGERVLFRLLNASATMEVSLTLPGHRFTVIALDGNPVPAPATVNVLTLDVAERAGVIVEMNNPGIWVFGSTDDDDRNMGMGVVIEYENRQGETQWITPSNAAWDYTVFASEVGGKGTRRDNQVDLRESPRRARWLATVGPSMENPGPIPIRFSPYRKASDTAL